MAVLNTSLYQSAPASPNGGTSPNNLEFYSAPSSPAKGEGEDLNPRFDDFEFETSKKFGNSMEFEVSENFECLLEVEQSQEKPKRERGGSLPTMAFADELFANGLVMPLKPPPRLHKSGNLQGSIPSSPRSPTSVFRKPFVWRASLNDDFDPFMVALQKVSGEENRGRSSSAAGSHHRRTRSHSPFRVKNSEWCNDSRRWNINGESGHLETRQNYSGSPFNMPNDLKGSPYARWVLDQTKQVEQLSPKGRKMFSVFTFVKRVMPVKTDHEGCNNKAILVQKIGDQEHEVINAIGEAKMKRIKGILLRYASFRKESSEEKSRNQNSTIWGSRYLKKLSFKMKGNARENRKKRVVIEEPTMAVVEYKRNRPILALCSDGIESP